MCSCLVVAVDIFSFSQFRAARDHVVNGLVETTKQSIFWVYVRLLEGVGTSVFGGFDLGLR